MNARFNDDADMMAKLIKAAEASVANMGDAFADEQKRNAARLTEAMAGIDLGTPAAASTAPLFAVSHDIKGMAATFGYSLETNVAASLCRLLTKVGKGSQITTSALQAIQAHFNALQLIIARDITGDGEVIGRQLEAALAEISEKAIASA